MTQHIFTLEGRSALVTGAGRGIGLALAGGLAAAGADVALAGRDKTGLDAAAEKLRRHGTRITTVNMDVRDVSSIRAGLHRAHADLGKLDILVNNAGVEQVCPALEVDEALWDKIIDTNLKGAFFAAQAAAQLMAGGAILNIASLTSERGIATAVPYGASKTGLLGMTRALAVEWAPRRIRVNALEPGYFRTALTEAFYQSGDWQRDMLAKIPAGRFGELDDLVGAAVFLCSDAARYITGTCLPVDGGTLAAL
jgi:NAD(P)-dependent dehydrogenase (short-subunit alcohol dehydrogenase family)